MTTTTCYNPGEHVMPYRGKGDTGSCWEGMVRKGQAVLALWGSEEEQVWIILGERRRWKERFKEKKKSWKRSSMKEGKGQRRRRKKKG